MTQTKTKYIDIFRSDMGEITTSGLKIVKHKDIFMIQQNTKKNSIWSKMAKMGLEVVQVYRILPGKDKDLGLGVYVQGKFIDYKKVNELRIPTY